MDRSERDELDTMEPVAQAPTEALADSKEASAREVADKFHASICAVMVSLQQLIPAAKIDTRSISRSPPGSEPTLENGVSNAVFDGRQTRRWSSRDERIVNAFVREWTDRDAIGGRAPLSDLFD